MSVTKKDSGILGAFSFHSKGSKDARGLFMELLPIELSDQVPGGPVAVNYSRSDRAGTVRGLHWQCDPNGQAKIVTCLSGEVFDMIVDVRKDSPTYGRVATFFLSATSGESVFIPKGCAHGWQAMEDGASILYMIGGARWTPASERGLNPTVGFPWPMRPLNVNERDLAWPSLEIL